MLSLSSELKFSDFNYYFLSRSNHLNGDYFSLQRNDIFRFWKDQWRKIYQDAGALDHFSQDDFFRQNFISALFFKDKVIGTLFFSYFDLCQDSDKEHNYMKFYSNDFFKKLENQGIQGIQRILSFEYYLIDKDWSKKIPQIGLGEVLIHLGINYLLSQSYAQAAVATVRTDVPACKQAERCGFSSLTSGLMKRNFPVNLMVAPQKDLQRKSSNELNAFAEFLWQSRNLAKDTSTLNMMAA